MGPVTLSGVFSGSAEYFVEKIVEIVAYNDDSIDDEEEIPEEEYDKPYVSLADDMGGLKGYIEAYLGPLVELEGSTWPYEEIDDEITFTTMLLIGNEYFDFNPQRNYDYLQYLFLDRMFGDVHESGDSKGPTLREVWIENTRTLIEGFDMASNEIMPDFHSFNHSSVMNTLGIENGDDKEGSTIVFTDKSNVMHLAYCFGARPHLPEHVSVEDLILFGAAPEGNLNYGMMTRGYMFIGGAPDRMLFMATSAYRNNGTLEENYEWYIRHLDILEGRLVYNKEAMEYVER